MDLSEYDTLHGTDQCCPINMVVSCVVKGASVTMCNAKIMYLAIIYDVQHTICE